jgi:integrase
MKSRGMGYTYQPQWRDRRTGEQRTAATWWISYSIHGKRHRENAHSTKEGDATKLLKLRMGQAAIGLPVGTQVERTTLGDILKMVEVDYAANGRKSLDRMKQASAHLKEFFDADSKARHLTADRIPAYQATRLGQGAKPATANYELAMLRRAFRLGHRAGKVAARPEIQMLHAENVRKGFFEPEQHRAVMKHLPDFLRPLAAIAYITGWRVRSELLTRQWRHVDFAIGWLRLDPGESKNGEGREFPFTPELRGILEANEKWSGQSSVSTRALFLGCLSIRTDAQSRTFAALGPTLAKPRASLAGLSMTFAGRRSVILNARAYPVVLL